MGDAKAAWILISLGNSTRARPTSAALRTGAGATPWPEAAVRAMVHKIQHDVVTTAAQTCSPKHLAWRQSIGEVVVKECLRRQGSD